MFFLASEANYPETFLELTAIFTRPTDRPTTLMLRQVLLVCRLQKLVIKSSLATDRPASGRLDARNDTLQQAAAAVD